MKISFPTTVKTTLLDQELVLMDLASGRYFGLNETATRMVELLQESGNLDTAVTRFCQEFDADAQRVREDLSALVSQLGAKGLVIVAEN